ncbi:hypothetical protein DT019_32045, partial [Streptomyces sp. SDr-06]
RARAVERGSASEEPQVQQVMIAVVVPAVVMVAVTVVIVVVCRYARGGLRSRLGGRGGGDYDGGGKRDHNGGASDEAHSELHVRWKKRTLRR